MTKTKIGTDGVKLEDATLEMACSEAATGLLAGLAAEEQAKFVDAIWRIDQMAFEVHRDTMLQLSKGLAGLGYKRGAAHGAAHLYAVALMQAHMELTLARVVQRVAVVAALPPSGGKPVAISEDGTLTLRAVQCAVDRALHLGRQLSHAHVEDGVDGHEDRGTFPAPGGDS